MLCRLTVGAALLTLSIPVFGADGLVDDLKARRARLMEGLGPGTVFIAWSAPERDYSRDVAYEYRQDSDLLYLTGIAQPDTVLVLMPGNETRKEALFIRPADPRREHREGHQLTHAEATAASGIGTVYDTPAFEPFVNAMLHQVPFDQRRGEPSTEYRVFFEAVKNGRASLSLLLEPLRLSEPLTPPYEFAEKARLRVPGLSIANAAPLVHGLRHIKTPYEQAVLAKSAEISTEAHRAGMRTARPGRWEYEVEAAIEQVYLSKGAAGWSYPSIVGSGPNATVLHYNASSRQLVDGDLLLVDAAANYQGLTVDITRTYPVSGRFSPAQRDIYQLVLAAQAAGIAAAQAGARTRDVEKAAEAVVRKGLVALGLVTDATSDQFRTWYTHGICHWIGMDVHDVGDYERPLAPGMAFVVEPGVYIRPQALDELPDTPENRAFRAAVAPAVAKYRDIGVRVEDSFLLTNQGLTRLSASVPRSIEEIEALLARR